MILHTATGPFDIKLEPQNLSAVAENTGLKRLSLDKRFYGALDATSCGEMVSFRSTIDGSAGYVAMETVQGSLNGQIGNFVLQHSSTLLRGQSTQSIVVVPDSGTGALSGLSGQMKIAISSDGSHTYHFEYSLQGSS